MPERRNMKRHTKRLTLQFGTDNPSHHGFTIDISDTGIFLKSALVYPPGTILTVVISIQDDGIVRLQGRVMWAKSVPANLVHLIKKVGMGVKIIKFLEGEKEYHRLVEMSPY